MLFLRSLSLSLSLSLSPSHTHTHTQTHTHSLSPLLSLSLSFAAPVILTKGPRSGCSALCCYLVEDDALLHLLLQAHVLQGRVERRIVRHCARVQGSVCVCVCVRKDPTDPKGNCGARAARRKVAFGSIFRSITPPTGKRVTARVALGAVTLCVTCVYVCVCVIMCKCVWRERER